MKYIVIHCADTPNDREVTAREVHGWHLSNGWNGIGYHYFIRRSGQLENGRPEYWMGSHVRKKNNGSIGICLAGRDEFTEKQSLTLQGLINQLLDRYPNAEVVGHCDLDSRKTCPNFDVKAWWESVK
jgi:N-acetyl-anhydromuramyl-L-alanine amidase AmpD